MSKEHESNRAICTSLYGAVCNAWHRVSVEPRWSSVEEWVKEGGHM